MGGVKRRVGYKRDARAWLLTDGVPRPSENGRFLPTYMGDYYLRLCTEVGCKPRLKELELFVSPEAQRRVEEIFEKHHLNNDTPLILINPGAAYGSSKCWTAEGFAGTADLIREQVKCNIAVTCAPHEQKLAANIISKARSKVINLASEVGTLDVLKALVKDARC